MAIIHPSYREKRRYIAVKVEDKETFKQNFISNFIHFFGIYGLARAGILFIEQNDYLIIRVSRKYVHWALVVLYFMGVSYIKISKTLKEMNK